MFYTKCLSRSGFGGFPIDFGMEWLSNISARIFSSCISSLAFMDTKLTLFQ